MVQDGAVDDEMERKDDQTATLREGNDEEVEVTECQGEKERSLVPEEDPIPDQHIIDFYAKSEEEKD